MKLFRKVLHLVYVVNFLFSGTLIGGEWIYFSSDRASQSSITEFHIWRVRPDGSQMEQITFGDVRDTAPSVSPDGRLLAFDRSVISQSNDCRSVWVKDLVDDLEYPITLDYDYPFQNFVSVTPTWSPDGTHLAFSRDQVSGTNCSVPPGTARIWISDVTNLNNPTIPIQIGPSGGASQTNPDFSPLGDSLLYNQEVGGFNPFTIYSLNLLTGSASLVIPHIAGEMRPRHSPDGTHFAFHSFRFSESGDIFTANLLDPVNSQIRISPTSGFQTPSWSPDGSKLVIQGSGDLFLINTDGTDLTSVVSDAFFNIHPWWAVDVVPEEVVIPVDRDSILRAGARNLNEGHNPLLHLGQNRTIVVGFDTTGFAVENLTSAFLTLTINPENPPALWGLMGRTVQAYAILDQWVEGNGRFFGLPISQKSKGSGSGVTWSCHIDTNIANHRADCFPRWQGGDTYPEPTNSVHIVNGLTGSISFDVTEDVIAGVNSWLIRREPGSPSGHIRFFAKEHPDTESNPLLSATLNLTFD